MLQEIVFSEKEIRQRVEALGQEIRHDYQDLSSPLCVIAMLKGSTYFLSDLTRAIDLPLTFDFIAISKLQSTSEPIRITKDVGIDLSGQHVLVLEEIVRSGLTTHYMLEHLEKFSPASIQLASLLVNHDQLMIQLPLKYWGFEIDYNRLVGYGMDYQEKYRNLRDIVRLEV